MEWYRLDDSGLVTEIVNGPPGTDENSVMSLYLPPGPDRRYFQSRKRAIVEWGAAPAVDIDVRANRITQAARLLADLDSRQFPCTRRPRWYPDSQGAQPQTGESAP